VPVIAGVGPVGGGAHSPNEYLETESLVTRSAALAGTLLLLASTTIGRAHDLEVDDDAAIR
jgi:acetylornithine deacetylase/succinyl-diaminopimelate desuccinylase-like protein